MASDIYEIHIPEQEKGINRVSVFLFKRKKKTKPTLNYVWPEQKRAVNGKTIDEVMQKVADIIKEDSDNIIAHNVNK